MFKRYYSFLAGNNHIESIKYGPYTGNILFILIMHTSFPNLQSKKRRFAGRLFEVHSGVLCICDVFSSVMSIIVCSFQRNNE